MGIKRNEGTEPEWRMSNYAMIIKEDLFCDDADVTLLTIYDKSEIENVSDEYIKWLISETGK